MSSLARLKVEFIENLKADWFGLDEAFYELDAGDVWDERFQIGKCATWEQAKDVVLEMLEEGSVRLVLRKDGSTVPFGGDARSIVEDKDNWTPFDLSRGEGYLLELVD